MSTNTLVSAGTTLAELDVTGTAADSIDTAGGLEAGSGNVALVGTDGKINGPLSSTIIDNLSAANLTAIPGGQITGAIAAVSGANLTTLNGSNVSSGTLANARLPTNVDLGGTLDVTGATTLDSTLAVGDHMRIAANGRLAYNLSDFNNVYGNIEVEGIGDDIGVNMYGNDADAHQLINIAAGDGGDATRRGVFKLIATDDGSNAAIAMGSVGGVSCDFNFFNRRPTDGLGQVMLRLKGDSSAEFPGVLKVTTGITSGTGSAVMVSQFNHTIDATDVSNGYVDVTTTINRSAYQSIEGGIYDVSTNVFHGGHASGDNYITYINGYTNLIRTGLGGDVQASDVIKYVVWHVE